MKNWNTLEADENRILTKHYTAGRGGRKIDKVIIHHNALNLSIKGIYDVWQTRRASAHYRRLRRADRPARVGPDTAWHAGNWDANTTSIRNRTPSPQAIHGASPTPAWRRVRTDRCCLQVPRPRPTPVGKNVFGHKRHHSRHPSPTSGTQHAAYMARAQYWYDHDRQSSHTEAKGTRRACRRT